MNDGLSLGLPPGPELLPASLPTWGCWRQSELCSRGCHTTHSNAHFLGHQATLGNGPCLAGQATSAHIAQTCSEDEGSTRTWQNGFAWLAGGRRQHGVGGWVGRQGSPLGARWNLTSFSGHITAKGKEKGKEEVRSSTETLQVSAPV